MGVGPLAWTATKCEIGTWVPQQDTLVIMTLYTVYSIHNYDTVTATTVTGVQLFYGKRQHLFCIGDSQNTRGKIIMRGIYNSLNYCVMFTIYK